MRDDDSIYYDLHQEGDEPVERSRGGRIASMVAKTVGITLVVAVYLILFFRIWGQSEPKMAKTYLWSEEAIAAAGEGGLVVVTQTPENYTLTDEETGESHVVRRDEYYTSEDGSPIDGNYKFSNFVYTPSVGEVQVSFRYNRSVLDTLRSDVGAEELPDYPFVFALTDGAGNVYTDYSLTAGRRGLHTYRRLIFQGLPRERLYGVLSLNVYYIGRNVDLSRPYLSMVIFDDHLATSEHTESPPSSPTPTTPAPAYHTVAPDKTSSGE